MKRDLQDTGSNKVTDQARYKKQDSVTRHIVKATLNIHTCILTTAFDFAVIG